MLGDASIVFYLNCFMLDTIDTELVGLWSNRNLVYKMTLYSLKKNKKPMLFQIICSDASRVQEF